MLSARGPQFRALAESQLASVAGDTLVTLALAGTLFFDVPSTEARGNVALYLIITLAPFAVLGPLLTGLFARFPTAYRAGLMTSGLGRVGVAIAMIIAGLSTLWLFPLALLMLVFSRLHGISRSSLLPVVVDNPVELVSANARLARIGVLGSAAVVPIGVLAVRVFDSWAALVLAVAAFGWAAYAAGRAPAAPRTAAAPQRGFVSSSRRAAIPRGVRLARLATAGVRLLNGFLLLLVAFAFRDQDAGLFDFGALLGAAGLGFLLSAVLSPMLERRLREEPMVVAALAVEAAAAFIAAQAFGLTAAAALAAAAGFAWGTAKFGYDALLQATIDPDARGRAFTSSETVFQLVWVLGAFLPVVVDIPIEWGLAISGIVALSAQVIYISALIVPLAEARRRRAVAATSPSEDGAPNVGELL